LFFQKRKKGGRKKIPWRSLEEEEIQDGIRKKNIIVRQYLKERKGWLWSTKGELEPAERGEIRGKRVEKKIC